jgi:hypothetical protein
MSDLFLIEKRGLYYRPDARGYTGLKRNAGRYSFAEAAERVGPNGPDGPQDEMCMWREDEAPEFSSACAWDLKMKEIAEKPARIIAAVCDEMNSNGFAHNPRVVLWADFDLSNFKEQESGFSDVGTEWVNQSGPGIAGDDFTGTLAVPIDGERLFVIDYAT